MTRAPRPLCWLAVAAIGGLMIDVARGLDRLGGRLVDAAEPRLPELVWVEQILRAFAAKDMPAAAWDDEDLDLCLACRRVRRATALAYHSLDD